MGIPGLSILKGRRIRKRLGIPWLMGEALGMKLLLVGRKARRRWSVFSGW